MDNSGAPTVLVVDDEVQVAGALRRCLEDDYEVVIAGSGGEALRHLESTAVDVILCDQRMPDMSGVDLLRQTRVQYPEAIRILLTGYTDPEDMVRAINDAAVYQYVPKPWQPDNLLLLIKRALESRELARRHRYLSRELKFSDNVLRRESEEMTSQLKSAYEFDKLVFVSTPMAQVCALARKAAVTDLPVLIQGETGTGKELLARAVHFFSKRNAFPFMAQNCGALPDDLLHSELFGHKRGAFTGAIADRLGLFPAADGGTVFLDEISEVSPSFQVNLLRFLQEGEVKPLGTEQTRSCNVRIIAASNRRLRDLVEQGQFRRDLYYRLCGFELLVPPLRDRADDIPVIASHAAMKYAGSISRHIAGISAEAMQCLQGYAFPGNVRELENEMRRMVALADEGEILGVKHLSPHIAVQRPTHAMSRPARQDFGFLREDGSLREKVERLEIELVADALARHNWNHSRAARDLGLSRVGLSNKIRRYHLEAGVHEAVNGHGR